MIKITLNGDEITVDQGTTVDRLLASLDLADKRVAVEINLDIVPRSHYVTHCLNDADKVEIVQAIGGGET